MLRKKESKEYFQSAVFGFNDALVSTTGVIVGVSTGTSDRRVVILAGIVTILVEALSMGAGQYLSLKSAEEYEGRRGIRIPVLSGAVMFVSYFLAGLVPLIPIILLPIEYARNAAIVAALVGLLILGIVKAKVSKASIVRSALEVLIIGGLATAIGIIAGNIFKV